MSARGLGGCWGAVDAEASWKFYTDLEILANGSCDFDVFFLLPNEVNMFFVLANLKSTYVWCYISV